MISLTSSCSTMKSSSSQIFASFSSSCFCSDSKIVSNLFTSWEGLVFPGLRSNTTSLSRSLCSFSRIRSFSSSYQSTLVYDLQNYYFYWSTNQSAGSLQVPVLPLKIFIFWSHFLVLVTKINILSLCIYKQWAQPQYYRIIASNFRSPSSLHILSVSLLYRTRAGLVAPPVHCCWHWMTEDCQCLEGRRGWEGTWDPDSDSNASLYSLIPSFQASRSDSVRRWLS